MSWDFAEFGLWRALSGGGKRRTRRRAVSRFHLRLETLEPRHLLSGVGGTTLETVPVATDNHYLTDEDSPAAGNVIVDDTGGGADTGGSAEHPLIVTGIDGSQFEPGEPVALASGASLTMEADGNFVYDPSTSPTLSALPAGTSATDSFEYTVSLGFSEVYTFGDSLSDVGRMYQLTYENYPPYPYSQGRASNDAVWIEYLADRLGHTSTTANNYAVMGAATGRENFNDGLLGLGEEYPGVLDEVDQFASDLGYPTATADPNALYVVWAGPNDMFLIEDPAQAEAVIQQAVGNLGTAITSLYGMGARQFVVPNMVDLGKTPLGSADPDAFTRFSAGFNTGLSQLLTGLEDSLPIDIIRVDMFSAFSEVIDNAASYGFTNTTEPCLVDLNVVGDPEQYVFWDTVHPTTRGHQMLADVVFDVLAEREPLVQTDTATVTIEVDDVTTPPEAAVDGPEQGVPGQPLTFTLSATDESPADAAAPITYAVDWYGDGSEVETIVGPAAGATVEHVFPATGVWPIEVTATDQDGDTGPAAERGVDVSTVAVIDGSLYVGGTTGADKIRVREHRPGKIRVSVNCRHFRPGDLAPDGQVFVFGQAGRDRIDAHRLRRSSVLYGGEGDDFLFGGRDDDVLHGDDGNDLLLGGRGDDMLFGGAGHDRLFGQLGDDQLDGGDGRDWLLGGPGSDVLDSGEGRPWRMKRGHHHRHHHAGHGCGNDGVDLADIRRDDGHGRRSTRHHGKHARDHHLRHR